MSKVMSIAEHSVTVETTKKETKTVEVTPETQFVQDGSPASMKDLKVGGRVVIHAQQKGDKLEAHVIRFGGGSPTKNH